MSTRTAAISAIVLGLLLKGGAPVAMSRRQSSSAAPGGTGSPGSAEPSRSARSVRIDAVVTDRQGRPILDLKAQDFEVVENGVAQKIDAVELFASPAAAAPSAAPSPIATDEDERAAAREPGTRLFALILDEYHVDAGSGSQRVRDAARRFVTENIRPADLLVVIKPLDPLTDIRFSRDRAAALRAIESFAGRNGDHTPRTEFEEKYIGRSPDAVRAARVQVVLSAIRAVTTKLGELEVGRAAIVLVSEGFARPAARERERRVPDLQGIVRAASRYHVAIYTADPGLASQAGSLTTAASDPAKTFLRTLASQTGGEAAFGPGGLDSIFGRVARDLDAYYVISYTSSDPTDGRFYDVQIRTKRHDTDVRARTGYWAPLDSEFLRAAREAVSRPARALRHSTLIQTWLGLTVQTDSAQYVIFTWEPSTTIPTPRRPGALPASLVKVRVTTPPGALLYEGEIRSPRAEWGAAEYGDAAVFRAPAGRIQIDLVVLAADGTQLDTAAQDVDVPDAAGAALLILPPQVLRAQSARDFREIRADAAAAPVARREFRRTDRLLLRVPVHAASRAPIALSARVVNRVGQPIRELPPLSHREIGGVYQFDLPLGWLAPGEYSIEFNARTEKDSARELLRFKLTG